MPIPVSPPYQLIPYVGGCIVALHNCGQRRLNRMFMGIQARGSACCPSMQQQCAGGSVWGLRVSPVLLQLLFDPRGKSPLLPSQPRMCRRWNFATSLRKARRLKPWPVRKATHLKAQIHQATRRTHKATHRMVTRRHAAALIVSAAVPSH